MDKKFLSSSLGASGGHPIPIKSGLDPVTFRSRRRRHRERQLWQKVAGGNHPLNDVIETENIVTGIAHLCFSEDGSWFQGNLVCPQDCIYKVTGRRSSRNRTISISPSLTNSMSIMRVEKRLASLSSEQRSYSYSDSTHFSPSSSASFDDDLDLIEDEFDEEDIEDSVRFNSCAYYNLNILDFETGLHYNVTRVLVRRGETDCWMSDGAAKQMRFESSQSFYGTSADLFVNAQLGPSFVELGLRVYKGELRFAYKDPICYPVTVEASQWCL